MAAPQHDPRHDDATPPRDPYSAADVCRPGSRDLDELLGAERASQVRDDAAVREYYERGQAFDAAVSEAFGKVAVPLGAKERLLAALAAEPVEIGAADAAEDAAEPATVTLPERLMSRRRWLAACGAAATSTAAGLGFYLWWQNRSRPEFTLEDVLNAVLAFHALSEDAGDETFDLDEKAPPQALPLSNAIGALRVMPRWRDLGTALLGRRGVAYEVGDVEEARATVYVLARNGGRDAPVIPHLPGEPMHRPETTGGLALGAWREDSRIVCLVVEGDAERYRSFLPPPRDYA